MSSGDRTLRDMIAKLREVATLAEDSAPAVAVAVRREIGSQIARGEGPDGSPWEPTKEGGRRPLRNAAKTLTVRALGSVVLVRISGYHARHHLGAVRGKVKREIIPTGKIPEPVTKAITRVVTGEFRAIMGPAV